MQLRPIRNHIVFQFIDEVDNKGQFVKTTKWGFVIPGHFDNSAKAPRWGTVVGVGPETKHCKVGQQVLINALKWTESAKFDGERIWRTDDTQIVAVRNTVDGKMKVVGNTVVFEREDKVSSSQTQSGIKVIGEEINTPKGTILQIGPDVDKELVEGSTIYFSDQNFFNEFDHKGKKLWYIDEPSIIMYEPA